MEATHQIYIILYSLYLVGKLFAFFHDLVRLAKAAVAVAICVRIFVVHLPSLGKFTSKYLKWLTSGRFVDSVLQFVVAARHRIYVIWKAEVANGPFSNGGGGMVIECFLHYLFQKKVEH